MKRWRAWIAGALALAGLAAVPSEGQARPMSAPDLLPMQNATPVGATNAGTAPTCQYYYRHRYGRPYYGYRRHWEYRRHWGYRRPYGYRRHFYGYRRPFYGYRHRYYRPIGFYGRPYGYGYRHHFYRPVGFYGRPYGYRHYGW